MKGFFLTFSLVFVFAAISLAQQENNFEIIGKAMSDGDLIDLIASNDFLFIASLKHNQTKITFIDIADPSHPQRLEPEFVLGDYYDFLLNDTLLFFSTSDGMVIFNVARPRSPSISAIIHDDHARGIMKKYGGLIASAFQNHIYLNDFSDIINPQHIADINCYQMVNDYAFYNNYLFVTESLYGFYSDCYLEVFDLSDLANPLLIYSSDITDSRRTVAIEIINHYMYLYQSTFQDISQFDGIYTYDISTPNAPRFIGNYFQDINIEITDLYNDRLYVGGNGQITILDVADPENPIISGAYSADVIRMFAADNNLYCRTWGGEALVLDINNPDSPQFVCSYIPGADAWAIARWSNYAYTADLNGSGFDVVDIHSLSTPFGTSHWRSGNQTHGIYADNGLLFIADNYGGVPIFSLEDPSNPELISNIVTNSFVQDVYSKDSLLYLATIDPWDHDGGIYIYNISEPAIPIEISHVSLPSVHSFLNSILPWNNYIFVAESDSGVGIYEAHDKYNPQFIEWHHTPPSALDLAISGNRLFVVDYSSGLYCLDISDPYHIADLGSVGIGTAYAVDINNDLAFVATTDSGLIAYDISDPYNMRLASRSEDVSWCTDILAIGDTLFVTTVYDGLVILRYNEAEGIDNDYQNSIAPKLSVTNYPNPFNSSTMLKYSIPANTTEKLTIFDILGRNVREFEISGNRHEITWDGKDQTGNPISSGVYFFAIKDHPETARKMILLK